MPPRPSVVPGETLSAEIAERCVGRSAREIAETIGTMVSQGRLRPGDRLPTVRSLARSLDVSSSTVADAWRVLTHHGVISTARRNGTTIRLARGEMTGRFWKVPATAGAAPVIDLSTGTPDTELLPRLAPVLARLPHEIPITSYIDAPVLPALATELHRRWPFPADAMTVVDGALDALDRLISTLVGFGDTVIVEDPTFPPILDMLERAGARVVGVPLDAEGIDLATLERHLHLAPVVAIIQPRAHNPTGVSMSRRRAGDLAELMHAKSTDTWIVEDDHSGDLAAGPGDEIITLGTHRPDRVVRVHSFSKSHGPDLRIAAIGGAAGPIADLVDRRRLGPSWTSRLVQHILVALLVDPEVDRLVAGASAEYARRRRAIVDGLGCHGIVVGDAEGLNLWVPVADEQRAVVALALSGIGVAPGAPFRVESHTSTPDLRPRDGVGQTHSVTSGTLRDARTRRDHIRVSVGNARGDLGPLVDAIARAGQR